MRTASLLVSLLAAAGAFAPSVAAPTSPDQRPPPPEACTRPYCPLSPHSREYCDGTAYNASATSQYVCGDSRLGPRRPPTNVVVDSLMDTYDRFGGLCPGAFLKTWWNETAGSWRWPPLDGFSVDDAGTPIKGNLTLAPGVMLDRFGSEGGFFVSPAAAPYIQRALPPSSLLMPANDPRYPNNYHVYRVLKPFKVQAGPILPWFGQPGQGVQYELGRRISELLADGFIEGVDPEDLEPDADDAGCE